MRRGVVYTIREGVIKKKNLLVKVFLPALVLSLGIVGLIMINGPSGAAASPVCVNDTAGPNDEPGQKDLTKLCVDYAGVPNTVETTWNWDETGTNGANTMDACNLFDTDGDGNINYSVCVTTTNDPAQLQSFTTYSCGDAKTDRCTSPVTTVSSGTTSCGVSQVTNDPFPGPPNSAKGDDYPNDTQGNCTVQLSTVGGASAKLVDVCSYPSVQPNSDPSDCVIAQEGAAKLEVKKQLEPSNNSGLFNLQIDSVTKATNVGDDGTTGEVIVTAGNNSTHSVGEIAGNNTTLGSYTTGIECRDLNGTGNVIASGSSISINVTVSDGADIVCVITNTIIKLSPTISTIPSAGGAIGVTLNDTATLSGGSNPTGDVTFKLYPPSDSTCSGEPTYTYTDSSAPYATTPGFITDAVGTWNWTAHYAGDSSNNPADSACDEETVTVTKTDTRVTTEVHDSSHTDVTNGSVALGSAVHDSATVGGQVDNLTVTGNITYYFYTDGNCDGTPTDETVTVGTESTTKTSLGAGSYSYLAEYTGDENYNSSEGICEPFTINKARLSVSTIVHDAADNDISNGNVALGAVTHDTATVNGGVNGFALPDVSFTLTSGYTDSCDSGAAVANNGTEGGAIKSADSSALAAGQYAYRAVVADSDNYYGETGICEPFGVNKAQLLISTNVHDANHDDKTNGSVPLGSVMHDTANLSGEVDGFDLPDVNFTLTNNYERSCSDGDSIANDGMEGDAYKLADSSALAAGTYAYRAVVASNSNYDGSTGSCEPFTVDKAQLSVTTAVHDSDHNNITNGNAALGSVTHDTATVTGGVDGFPLPDVSFTLTSSYDNSCDSGAAVSNDGTESGATKSAGSIALGAGQYAYRAVVANDSNYDGTTGECEPFTVEKATISVVTEIHNDSEAVVTSVAAGTTVHDKATVTGIDSFEPGGDVDFTFYVNDNCSPEGTASGTDIGLVNGIAHPSDSQGPLNAGSYSFKAHYNGDGNYSSQDAECEPLSVTTVSPDISTTPNPAAGTVGVVLNDSAELTGGYNPTGSITFNLYDPSDPTCSGNPIFTNTVSVNGAGIYDTSAGFTSDIGGTWRWVAVYSGDINNDPASDNCDDELMTISAPPVVLGEQTGGVGDNPPQVLAASTANTGQNIIAESLIAAGLMAVTLLTAGYGYFANRRS